VLGLEPLETLRCLKYISEKSLIILNTQKRYPKNTLLNQKDSKPYPSTANIIDLLDQFSRRVIALNLTKLSNIEYNSSIYANIIAIGICAREFRDIFQKKVLTSLIKEFFHDFNLEENLSAFELGYNLINDL
jgi:Pyruvate/2-oxoacid:ferredoxin oxidoreductase gamma subunit